MGNLYTTASQEEEMEGALLPHLLGDRRVLHTQNKAPTSAQDNRLASTYTQLFMTPTTYWFIPAKLKPFRHFCNRNMTPDLKKQHEFGQSNLIYLYYTIVLVQFLQWCWSKLFETCN